MREQRYVRNCAAAKALNTVDTLLPGGLDIATRTVAAFVLRRAATEAAARGCDLDVRIGTSIERRRIAENRRVGKVEDLGYLRIGAGRVPDHLRDMRLSIHQRSARVAGCPILTLGRIEFRSADGE